MKRIAVPVFLLSACGAPAAPSVDERIECALDGAAEFSRVCTLEPGSGRLLTVRGPSGGFRRLEVSADGRGVAAADGAEPARVRPLGGNRIEVSIGDDRYRLPARTR